MSGRAEDGGDEVIDVDATGMPVDSPYGPGVAAINKKPVKLGEVKQLFSEGACIDNNAARL